MEAESVGRGESVRELRELLERCAAAARGAVSKRGTAARGWLRDNAPALSGRRPRDRGGRESSRNARHVRAVGEVHLARAYRGFWGKDYRRARRRSVV